MTDQTHITISCPGCGTVYAEKDSSELEPNEVSQFFPCQKCGHKTGHVAVTLPMVGVGVSVGMRAKGTAPGKKKPVLEARAEPSIRRSTGTPVFHERLIDRTLDIYVEKVTISETGEVIHHNEEPLSQHQGHGSAKPKGKTPKKEGVDG